jgi:DNA-binding response OmpR family regulator
MNDLNQRLDPPQHRTPLRLERIPSPFVWSPSRPANVRVAVVGGDLVRAAGTTQTLLSSGHLVTLYPCLDTLLGKLRRHPRRFSLVVLEGSRGANVIVPALERLRAQGAALAIVLIADDDPRVLVGARRLGVQEVLAPPVHPVALRAAIVAALCPPRGELCFSAGSRSI